MKKQKSLINNFIYNTLFTLLNLLFPLITLPYTSRVIEASGIGKVNFANSIVNYFLIIASLGIPLYGVREIAKVRENKKALSKTYSEIFFINLLSTLISIVAYYLMVFNFDYFAKDYKLFIVSGFLLLLNALNIDWFYQGLEEYKYIALRSVVFKVISLVLLFTMVKTREDYINYALINVIALSGNNIINILNINKFTHFSFSGLEFKKHIRPICILLSIQVAVNIYVNLDTTMTGVLAGEVSVGFYSNAVKLNKIIVSVVTSVGTILLPRLSYHIENNNVEEFNTILNKALKVIIMLSIPAMTGVLFLSREIVLLMFKPEFIPVIYTMKILTPLIIILSIGNLFGTQILMPLGKENKLLFSVIIGAVINFTLNLMLIPKMNENGAAISTIIAELVVMIIQVYIAKSYVKIKLDFKFICKIILSNAVMTIVLYIISRTVDGLISNLISSVIFGVISYIGTSIILKEETVIEILRKNSKIKI